MLSTLLNLMTLQWTASTVNIMMLQKHNADKYQRSTLVLLMRFIFPRGSSPSTDCGAVVPTWDCSTCLTKGHMYQVYVCEDQPQDEELPKIFSLFAVASRHVQRQILRMHLPIRYQSFGRKNLWGCCWVGLPSLSTSGRFVTRVEVVAKLNERTMNRSPLSRQCNYQASISANDRCALSSSSSPLLLSTTPRIPKIFSTLSFFLFDFFHHGFGPLLGPNGP